MAGAWNTRHFKLPCPSRCAANLLTSSLHAIRSEYIENSESALASSRFSATIHSVVKSRLATDAAFCRALRTSLVGSKCRPLSGYDCGIYNSRDRGRNVLTPEIATQLQDPDPQSVDNLPCADGTLASGWCATDHGDVQVEGYALDSGCLLREQARIIRSVQPMKSIRASVA